MRAFLQAHDPFVFLLTLIEFGKEEDEERPKAIDNLSENFRNHFVCDKFD